MKKLQRNCLVLIAASLCAPATTRAQQDIPNAEQSVTQDQKLVVTNRLTFSARVGFNIKAQFSGFSSLPTPGSTRRTPGGDAYNYDDGYVLTDNSGNFGGQTWYWGYDDSSRQISGNNILMSRSTAASGAGAATVDGDPSYGGELMFRHLLSSRDDGMQLGIEIAGNYQNLSMENSSTLVANAMKTSYPFGFTPGTTPPSAAPGSPYLGSYQGPGFVMNATPGAPITTLMPGAASIQGHRQFDADLWGMRLGLYVEYPATTWLKFSLSGGAAMAVVDADVSWSERAIIGGAPGSTVSGTGHSERAQWGFYVAGNAFWDFSEHWGVTAGVQLQSVQDFTQTYGGRSVTLDLGRSIFATLGISYNF